MEKKLNVDVPGAISDFESAAKEFELKEKLYRIIFRGKGLEFDKYRDYAPDEDASSIDWKASLRANKLIAKQYIEEREINILFAVDISENMLLGSSQKLKCEYSVEIFSALAHLMVNSNDRVGIVTYNDNVREFMPPKGGMNNFYILVDALSNPDIYKGGSRFDKLLNFLLDYVDKSIDVVIFISDFIKVGGNVADNLFLVANKFECMAFMVKDLLDKTFPDVDREVVVEDPRTGEQILINPKKIKYVYERNAFEQANLIKNLLIKSNVDFLEIMTDKPFAFSLAAFLGGRAKIGKRAAI